MEKIGLVVDLAADLPQEEIEKHQIETVPFKIDLQELKDVPGENIYQKMKEGEKRGLKTFIKTSQPSPRDFIESFKKQLAKYKEIICITISSKLSGSYNSALQAKNFLEKEIQRRITIIDSLSGSGGEGLLTLEAQEMIEKGLNIEKIKSVLKSSIPKTKVIGILGDPKWLSASGRLPRVVAFWLEKMQKIGIRPLIGVKKGRVGAVGIRKGIKEISTAIFKEFESRISRIKNRDYPIKTAITHADNPEQAAKLKEMIEKLEKMEVSFVNLIDSVLGGHVGPGTLILSWQEVCSSHGT